MNTDNITEPSRFTVATRRHLGQRARTISYGTAGEGGATVTVDTRTGLRSTAPATDADAPAVSIVFYPWNWDYDSIVSAVINAEIPPDSMTAIQNNYIERVIAPLLDPSATAASFSASPSGTDVSTASASDPATPESPKTTEAAEDAEAEAERERLRLEASAEMARMQSVRARAKLLARQAILATQQPSDSGHGS